MQQAIYPKRIIDCAEVEHAEHLLLHQDLQVDLIEHNLAVFHAGSHIILDYGKEMRGGIRILAHSSDLSAVRVRFGESVGECCAELGAGEEFSGKTQERQISEKAARQNATNDHAVRDFWVVLPNWSDMPLGDTGFRFVRLDFTGECTIKSVPCINTILSHRAKYIYRGDREIEKIFSVAKRTVDLCAGSGYIWDGIKRDRLVWVGDLTPELLALTTIYGRTKEAENTIDFARTQAVLPDFMNYQPVYSMWWIIALQEYLSRTGAEDFVQKQMDYLEALVRQLAMYVDEAGNMHHTGCFLDWPHAGKPELMEGVRAINIMAEKAAISLLEHFGRNADVARQQLSRLMKQEIRPVTKLVAALKYWAVGELSAEEKDILLSGGIAGMSTFMSYFILEAVAGVAGEETAVAMLKEYYGAMLSRGGYHLL